MRRLAISIVLGVLLLFSIGLGAHASGEGAWPGVDETVVERIAQENGRAARAGLLDLEGDALLFAFLVAGTAGGFVMGYYFRDIARKKRTGDKTGVKTDAP